MEKKEERVKKEEGKGEDSFLHSSVHQFFFNQLNQSLFSSRWSQDEERREGNEKEADEKRVRILSTSSSSPSSSPLFIVIPPTLHSFSLSFFSFFLFFVFFYSFTNSLHFFRLLSFSLTSIVLFPSFQIHYTSQKETRKR